MQRGKETNERQGKIIMDNLITVPNEIHHPFFFPVGKTNWREEDATNLYLKDPFIYEVAYYTGIRSLMPWEMLDKSIPLLLKEWELVKEELKGIFDRRDHKASAIIMKKGIGLFIEFLHWTNGVPVRLSPAIPYESFNIKPVNINERLDFILSRPNSYHSYMQVVELMIEMEKIYRKQLAIKKIK